MRVHTSVACLGLTAAFACASRLNERDSCVITTPTCASPGPVVYTAEPCFPNTGVCYPTNYYAASDQGQFSGSTAASQLKSRCQGLCDAQSQCASYVGIVNKAADTNLATGTCFLYNVQQIYPRQCANPPSVIFAYYKHKSCPTTTSSTTKSTTTSTTSTTKSTTSSTTSSSTTKSTTSSTTSSSTTSSSTTSSSTTSSSTTSSSTTSSSTTSSSTTSSSTTSSSTTSSSTTSSSTTSSSTTSSSTTSSSTTSSSTTTSSTTTSSTTTLNCASVTKTDNAACPTVTGQGRLRYGSVYSGQATIEDPAASSANSDPGDYPTITTTLSASLDTCTALQQCANLAFGDPMQYDSFNLYYRFSTCQWFCVQFYDFSAPSDYDVPDPDVGRSFGYNAVSFT